MRPSDLVILANVGNLAAESRVAATRRRVRQAAAVCYRCAGDTVEFLLVGTSRGKWTFPKGYINGYSAREAALREALEEAGAIGDLAQEPLCSYLHSKGVFWKAEEEFLVRAFLLEVMFTVAPAEELRNPTWFGPAEAKEKLIQGRELRYQKELEAVLDEALKQIRQRSQANHHRAS
ncbi:MAG: NUDIX domain-containing protein [Acidobacteriales bacterium]|nr:NUDIX domain-containing protein [Terriglobales bacterium]